MKSPAPSGARKKDSSSSSEESDSEDEQPAKAPVSSEFRDSCLNCFVSGVMLWIESKPVEKFHNSMCLLITEAKAGTAPTPTTKSIGLGKVAAQKKQESSSEDSSSDSEDEQPTKV